MKTYSTYQEAKIANPESDIYHHPKGHFFPFEPRCYEALVFHCCNPADHCMTVERFLKDGNEFVEGDLIITESGVLSVGREHERMGCSVSECNEPSCVDSDIYILRAAALENPRPEIHKDSEFYKKSRTKVEFVKVDKNTEDNKFWEVARDYAEEVFELFLLDVDGEYEKISSNDELLMEYRRSNLYRRIETPMTEREAFIEALNEVAYGDDGFISTSELFSRIVDSGKFKLVN